MDEFNHCRIVKCVTEQRAVKEVRKWPAGAWIAREHNGAICIYIKLDRINVMRWPNVVFNTKTGVVVYSGKEYSWDAFWATFARESRAHARLHVSLSRDGEWQTFDADDIVIPALIECEFKSAA